MSPTWKKYEEANNRGVTFDDINIYVNAIKYDTNFGTRNYKVTISRLSYKEYYIRGIGYIFASKQATAKKTLGQKSWTRDTNKAWPRK